MKGFGSGLVWGGFFGVFGLVFISQGAPFHAQKPQTAAGGAGIVAPEPEAPADPAPMEDVVLAPQPGGTGEESAVAPEPGGLQAAGEGAQQGVVPGAVAAATEPPDAEADMVDAPTLDLAIPAHSALPEPQVTGAVAPAPAEAVPLPGTASAAPESLADDLPPAAPQLPAPPPQTFDAQDVPPIAPPPMAAPVPLSPLLPIPATAVLPSPPPLVFAEAGPATPPPLPPAAPEGSAPLLPPAAVPDSSPPLSQALAPPRFAAQAELPPPPPSAPPGTGAEVPSPPSQAVEERQPPDTAKPLPPSSPPLPPATAELPSPSPKAPEPGASRETVPADAPERAATQLPASPRLTPVIPLPEAKEVVAFQQAAGFAGKVIPGVKVGRLPQIKAAQPATGADVADPANLPPVRRYARPFENPSGKPVFAIVLIDDGDPALDRQALAALPFPVTVALDPMLPDAAAHAAIYVQAGKEVVMLASGIPKGASAADLEVTFSGHGRLLPEAVAVLDLAQGGFQNDRLLATQVVGIVKDEGRGLLTYDRGLNAADQVASREGLPSATLFRRLDAEAGPSAQFRRYLDRAAFKAAQEGRVVVVADARPDTIAALMEWSLEGRAATVALAPVTGALRVR